VVRKAGSFWGVSDTATNCWQKERVPIAKELSEGGTTSFKLHGEAGRQVTKGGSEARKVKMKHVCGEHKKRLHQGYPFMNCLERKFAKNSIEEEYYLGTEGNAAIGGGKAKPSCFREKRGKKSMGKEKTNGRTRTGRRSGEKDG